MLSLTGIDLRGHIVSISATGGPVLFSSALPADPPPTPTREVAPT